MIPIARRLHRSPLVALLLTWSVLGVPAHAQTYSPPTYTLPAPSYTAATPPPQPAGAMAPTGEFLAPPQLEDLVARIALYPDDLVGIILPAATVPLQVVEAARYLDAVRADPSRAPEPDWDNSVVALLNYPDVINMMNRDLDWTEKLGAAVVNQQPDVIAAIGSFRARAQAAGNLRSDERQIVEYDQNAIRIRPANPQIIYVPYYEPERVVVYQSEPVFRYFPRPCPVYYFNYTSGYPSGFTNFWGVSTMFTLSWGSRRVRTFDYDYYNDPWYDHPRPGFFYRRGGYDRDDHDWRDRDHDRDHERDRGNGDWHDRGDDHGTVVGHRPRERDWEPHRPSQAGGHGAFVVNPGSRGEDRSAGRDRPATVVGPQPTRDARDDDGPRGGGRPSAIRPDNPSRFSQPSLPVGVTPRQGADDRINVEPGPRRNSFSAGGSGLSHGDDESHRFGPAQGFAPAPRDEAPSEPRTFVPQSRSVVGPAAPRPSREPEVESRGSFSQPPRVQQREMPAARMGPPAPRNDVRNDEHAAARHGSADEHHGGHGGRDQRD